MNVLGKSVEHLTAGGTGSERLVFGLPFGNVGGPVFGQLAAQETVEFSGFGGELFFVGIVELLPFGLRFFTLRNGLAEVAESIFREEELVGGGPAESFLGGIEFVVAEGFAMGFEGVLFLWAAVADVGFDEDERGLGGFGFGFLDGFGNRFGVIAFCSTRMVCQS